MKIDRLTIANGLKAAGFSDENASAVATSIGVEIEDATKDMASLKDLDVISQRNRAEMHVAIKNVIIWTVSMAGVIIAVMVALKLFA